MKVIHRNLTRTATCYPAPVSFYGKGWFYIKDMADHAHRERHKVRGEAGSPGPISVLPSQSNKNWIAPDGDRPCAVCGRGFTPMRTHQKACSAEHSREHKLAMNRISDAARRRKGRAA